VTRGLELTEEKTRYCTGKIPSFRASPHCTDEIITKDYVSWVQDNWVCLRHFLMGAAGVPLDVKSSYLWRYFYWLSILHQ